MTMKLEFITPAFLCGANQNRAELRPASIRGEIRWWFRVLGASAAEERAVFGGVSGSPDASKIVVRVRDVQSKHEAFPRFAPMSDFGYIYYFASVSGERKGIRIEPTAYFAPGTRFTLDVLERRPIPEASRARFAQSVTCFARLGTLGLRGTRGCGALTDTDSNMTRADFAAWAKSLPSSLLSGLAEDRVCDSAKSCQETLGGFLRRFRKECRLSGKSESALGFSEGKKRESSALRLRPIRVKEGFLPVLVYTDQACSQSSLLTNSNLKFQIHNL